MAGENVSAAGTAQVAAATPSTSGRLSMPEICALASDLLRPFFEKKPIALSNDTERRLLVSVTKLYNILEACQGYSDCDSIFVTMMYSPTDHFREWPHNCVEEIISLLVNCLSVSSRFVQHISGKSFVALSTFLLEDESHWKGFVKALYHTLDEAILKVHLSPSLSSLLVMTELVHIFQSIVKTLKLEEIHRDGAYLSVLSEYMLVVNWDILHGLYMNEHEANKDSDKINASVDVNVNCLELKAVLLGAIVRLFCSFASDDWLEEPSDSLSAELPSLYGIAKLVPKLLCWSFSFDDKYNSASIVVYARQKIVVLMVRASSFIIQEYPTLVLWLQLLRKYFSDVLALPLSQSKDGLEDSLESSPFLMSSSQGTQAVRLHIWRRVLFLLFKWSINLISLSNNSCVNCMCTTASPSSNCVQMNGKNCTLGLSILDDWVQRHFPLEQFSKYESYLMQCRDFAAFFLRLFMSEDDVMFKMLLQLLDFSLIVNPVHNTQLGLLLQKNKADRKFHLSCIFDPIQLFHLFLKELQYDHTVFLDWLISKDTGVECVQYLLRFLRLVCQSSQTFIRFSSAGQDIGPYCKKKKLSSVTSAVYFCEASSSFGREYPLKLSLDEFERIRKFLFSLKTSIESLNKKGLFPYNPAAIIRSFTQFQVLCCPKEKSTLP